MTATTFYTYIVKMGFYCVTGIFIRSLHKILKESLPLTDMWYIKGRVESIVLHRKVGDFLHNEDKRMKKTGFYIIKDKFLRIWLIRILKAIRQGTDRINIVLKIQIQEFTG